ncbi:MAG TPA: FecR family protein [Planctomycetota bacterium]|nr:FecR family protein [Planctomycetota bacterium]
MDEQRHINLLEAYIDSRLTQDERRELEMLLVNSAPMRMLFWEYMQQHAFTQELLSEAQGRSIALTESRAATLESLKREAAQIAGASSSGRTAAAAVAVAGTSRIKTGRQAGTGVATGTRRVGRTPTTSSSFVFWMAVAAGLLLVGGVGGWYFLHETSVSAPVARIQSIATVQTVGSAGGYVIRGTSSLPLTAPLDLFSGDLIKANPGAKAATASIVTYPDGTQVSLSAGVSVTLSGSATVAKRLELDEGTLVAAVSPQPAGKPFTLATPHAEIKVVGTQFTLAVMGDKTRLTVREGHVQLTRASDKQAVEVLAKQYVEAGQGIDLAVKAVEESKPPVVATEPRHEPEHPVTRPDDLGSDELQGRVIEIADKGTSFGIQVTRAANRELIGKILNFAAGWNADRKQPKEVDIKQIRDLHVGDIVRIHYFFEEHYRFRTMAVVERARHEDLKPHEQPVTKPAPDGDGHGGAEGRDGKDIKPAADVNEH